MAWTIWFSIWNFHVNGKYPSSHIFLHVLFVFLSAPHGHLTPLSCYVEEKVDCPLPGPCVNNGTSCTNHGQFCYSMWMNVSGNVSVVAQGCWHQNDSCQSQTCTARGTRHFKDKHYHFCCCKTDFCNERFSLEQVPMHPNATSNGK